MRLRRVRQQTRVGKINQGRIEHFLSPDLLPQQGVLNWLQNPRFGTPPALYRPRQPPDRENPGK